MLTPSQSGLHNGMELLFIQFWQLQFLGKTRYFGLWGQSLDEAD